PRWHSSRRWTTRLASIGRRSRKRSRRSASIGRNRCHGRCENPRGHMNAVRSLVEVRVPDMGNFKDVAVIEVLVKPGDTVVIDSPLVTLESDKATMDVPSTAVGVVEKLHTNKGGKVNTGDLIATVRANGSAPAAAPAAAAPPATVQPATALPSRSAAATPTTTRRVSRSAGRPRAADGPGCVLHAFLLHVYRAPVAHPEDLRPAASCELGECPARHAVRPGRHHRARAGARRAEGSGPGGWREAHAARLH